MGFDVLFRFLFRAITIEELAGIARKRLGVDGKVINCPYAEMGMDIDNIIQYKILSDFLKTKEK